MALNSSGPISLGGTTTGQSVGLELGGSGTSLITLNDATVRFLLGKSSGAISLYDAYAKSYIPPIGYMYGTAGSWTGTYNGYTTTLTGYAVANGRNGIPASFGILTNPITLTKRNGSSPGTSPIDDYTVTVTGFWYNSYLGKYQLTVFNSQNTWFDDITITGPGGSVFEYFYNFSYGWNGPGTDAYFNMYDPKTQVFTDGQAFTLFLHPGYSNTASGTLLSTYCSGNDKYGTYADGHGGSYAALIQANSTDCITYYFAINGFNSTGNYYWSLFNGYINYGIYNGFTGRTTESKFGPIYDPTGTTASTDISPVDPGDGYLYYRGPYQYNISKTAYFSIGRLPK
jgi:hypothetical protein